MGAEFGLLGAVEVRVDGWLVDVGHARQRGVLVVLLVEANRVVSADQLVHRVWGDQAPRRARETLYNYLSRLRHALSPLPDIDLGRQGGRYVLTVDPMAVDLHRFGHLVAEARVADDEDRALVLFEQALELWRGEPFAGLDTPWLTALRATLERNRFAVELDCTDLQLRRGQHGWLLGEITARAEAYPLDERVAGQLILALYRCGRQAEALEHFQQLRMRLADDLGIDPSPGLHRLYEQILTTDPALAIPATSRSTSSATPAAVPRQLPARTPHFVGRAAELHQLTSLLDGAPRADGGTVVITAIDGTAGIGKTALALHWAHQAADRFPDGQLYVNLRGFDPTGTPVHPVDALRGFLSAFEIPPDRIPAALDAQAGLYRSLLADHRVLVVLDNARDAEQVRPLLPASPHCLVVITSRNQLTGLVTQEGARPFTLDVLTAQEARALLARHLGPDRINAESDTIADLIDHCARLPLALAIVAARASTHPGFALRVLAKELADEHTRLDALDTGEDTISVQAVFSWSYHQLSPPAARMFRLLGLHPGPDLALPAAAHLTDLSPHKARAALSELTRAHLLTQRTPGRYTFHDLLRAHATHLVTTHDPQNEQHAALNRLFDHYLHTTAAGMDTLRTVDEHRIPRVQSPTALPAPISDPATAQHWLDTERANLIAIVAQTAAHGWRIHTAGLANTVLLRFLEIGVDYLDSLATEGHAQHTAHRFDNRVIETLALSSINLGLAHWQQGRTQRALHHHQQALALSRESGFRMGEAWALGNLGLVSWRQARYPEAIDQSLEALAVCRDIGYRAGEALTLNHLGGICWRLGLYLQTIDYHQQALAICAEIDFPSAEALALTNLGVVYCQQGLYRQATDYHEQALTICRKIGYRTVEAVALTRLGLIGCQQGNHEQATDNHQQALTLCREIGDRANEPQILNGLGETHWAGGQHDQALAQHTAALTLATETGDRYEQARAHHGLACTYHTTGDLEHARHHWQQAMTRYAALGVPDGDDVRARLATLDQANQ